MATLGQLSLNSSYDDVAEAIIGEVKRRGYTWDEAIGVVADGIQWYGSYTQGYTP